MSSFYAVRRGRGTRAAALEFMAQGEGELTEEDKAGLSPDQVEALRIALDRRVPAMFLTGAAGTGKSRVLERIIECLRKGLGRKRVIVPTPTQTETMDHLFTVHHYIHCACHDCDRANDRQHDNANEDGEGSLPCPAQIAQIDG